MRGVSQSPAPREDALAVLLQPAKPAAEQGNTAAVSGPPLSLPLQPLPGGAGLRNGKFLNIDDLFHAKPVDELVAHGRANGIGGPGEDGVTEEEGGGEEKPEHVPDEARPPPGPPTMLEVVPPPPGQLQLSGLRTNSSKARPIGALPRTGLDRIDAAAAELVAAIAPSPQEQEELQEAYAQVAALLAELRPGATAHLYGSAASGLCLRANKDLDVTLQVESDDVLDRDGQAAVLVELAEGLKENGMLV